MSILIKIPICPSIFFSKEEVGKIVKENLISLTAPGSLLLFKGGLGAGKTTIIRELCSQLGIDKEEVTSPTFTYMQNYTSSSSSLNFYHFDLYRLNTLSSFYHQGFEEYLEKRESIVFIEWPDIIFPVLEETKGKEIILITLSLCPLNKGRYMSIEKIEHKPSFSH